MMMPPYHGATSACRRRRSTSSSARVSDAIDIPIMIQDAPVSGTPLSARLPRAHGAARSRNVALLQDRGAAGAAAKLRELIELGGDAIEGPWDGEEAITLLADLDAGATGAMTGGGYPGRHPPDRRRLSRRRSARKRSAAYERWLPLINYENRQCGLLAAKALMKEGGVIALRGAAASAPPLHPATRAGLIEIARRLDPMVLRWGR